MDIFIVDTMGLDSWTRGDVARSSFDDDLTDCFREPSVKRMDSFNPDA